MLKNSEAPSTSYPGREKFYREETMKYFAVLFLTFFSLQGLATEFDRNACLAEEFENLRGLVGVSQAGRMYRAEAACALKQKQESVPELIRGFTNDIVCGEMDPFVVGDVCVLYTTDLRTGKSFGLVYSDYDWARLHIPEPDSIGDWIGEEFEASSCELIADKDELRVLKGFRSGYEYLSCYVYEFNWFYRLIDEF